MATDSERDKKPLAFRGLSSLYSVWIAKRERDGRREFRNEQDMMTAVYIANHRGAANYANADNHIKPERR